MSQRQPVPRALERLVRKCLEKKPDDRWHSARDLKPALELIDLDAPPPSATSTSIPISAPIPSPSRKPWLWPAIAATVVVIAGAAAGMMYLKPAAPERATRFEVTLPEGVTFSQYVSLSPDGRKLVFNATGAQSGLWVRDLDTLQWRHLAGTENSTSPFWSPDSRFLGFSVGTELKKIEVAGGPPQTLATTPNAAGTGAWSPDGVIVFGGKGSGPIRRVSASGGVATEVVGVDASRGEGFAALPTFLPDGKHFLYLRAGNPEVAGIYAASLEAKPSEQSKERILATTLAVPFVDGNVFFLRDGTLMAQPFDADKLQLQGEPVPVAEHVGAELSAGYFSVSSAGVLAYRTGVSSSGDLQPSWFDRQGKATGSFGQLVPDRGLTLSPDGTRAVGRDADQTATGDIWLLDFPRSVRTRLTFRQAPGSFPIWSPDGNRIAFATGGVIYEKAASGAGEEKALFTAKPDEVTLPTSWSRDGRFLLYHTNIATGTSDVGLLPLEGERKPVQLLTTPYNELYASFSPDMRWIAYTSTESGRVEIYVRPFVADGPSGPAFGEGRWQISRDGGAFAKWRADGKEILFRSPADLSPMSVDVSVVGSAFQAGIPKRLFAGPQGLGWDVSADGQRFLFVTSPQQQSTGTPITVVLNWKADLKR